MIVWSEPFMPDYPQIEVVCSMTKENATLVQHLLGADEGYEYENDLEALVDFMVVRDAIDTDNEITLGIKNENTFIGH